MREGTSVSQILVRIAFLETRCLQRHVSAIIHGIGCSDDIVSLGEKLSSIGETYCVISVCVILLLVCASLLLILVAVTELCFRGVLV